MSGLTKSAQDLNVYVPMKMQPRFNQARVNTMIDDKMSRLRLRPLRGGFAPPSLVAALLEAGAAHHAMMEPLVRSALVDQIRAAPQFQAYENTHGGPYGGDRKNFGKFHDEFHKHMFMLQNVDRNVPGTFERELGISPDQFRDTVTRPAGPAPFIDLYDLHKTTSEYPRYATETR